MVVDLHSSLKSGLVRKFLNKVGTTLRILEEFTQYTDRAELYMGLLKRGVTKDMKDSNSPMRLWCYAAERRSAIMTMIANNPFQLQGQNPHMATWGDMADISNLCQHEWYKWVYFRDINTSFPYPNERLGCALGPSD